MARILLGGRETSVSEGVDEVLNRIVKSKDGIRHGNGIIVAPPGWVMLTTDAGDDIYIPTEQIGYIRED
ncbi:MAG TPA: hypothetical protein VN892_08720 [Solirubrobacteraceae bacterium]|nr:hypothetical protein [Solirubrobacteraceae bacterium]